MVDSTYILVLFFVFVFFILPFFSHTSLFLSFQRRLLHPAVNTDDILTQYVSTIRALRELDPSGIILENVCFPLREYLRYFKTLFSKFFFLTQFLSYMLNTSMNQGLYDMLKFSRCSKIWGTMQRWDLRPHI